MKNINKIAMAAAKIVEILHWIGTVSMAVIFVLSLVLKDWLSSMLSSAAAEAGNSLTTYGYEIEVINANGAVNMTAVTMFSIVAVIILSLYAMIFRNAYLIIRTSQGRTRFAQGDTPFQKDIIRMLKEIGIFLISVPVTELIMSIIIRLVIGEEIAEMSVNVGSLVVGILVLCLTQYFSYGAELQKDVDGLL